MYKQDTKLAENLKISRLVHGHWRLAEWKLSKQELLKLTQQVIDLGVNTFDHADIYGDYSCERIFGDALRINKNLRQKIQIITKCGIKLLSDKYPERSMKSYDYSYGHIVTSVENSLKNLGTDYLDLLLLHRPSPIFNPAEVSRAFADLKQSGKVRYFGVSNFKPQQFEMLNSYVEEPLVTNQVEISPSCLEHFDNGNIEYCISKKIKPMSWSPLAGGTIFKPTNKKQKALFGTLLELSEEFSISIDTLIYAWLLKHPSSIIPVVGTGKIERIKNAVDALNVELTTEQWLKIYISAKGKDLP